MRVKRRCTTQLAKTQMSTDTTERRDQKQRNEGSKTTTSTGPRSKANGRAHANGTRPAKPPYRFAGDLPAALEPLRTRKRWLTWGYVWNADKEKWDKPPRCAHTGRPASINNPANLGTFPEAVATAARLEMDGVGYLLMPDDDLTGIDLDDCITNSGSYSPLAAEVIGYAETYAEISPSGKGIRAFAHGKVGKALKDDASGVEIYCAGRYLTVTGRQIDAMPCQIKPAPQTLARLTAIVEAARGPKRAKPKGKVHAGGDFWGNVNAAAIANLDAWVPALHPKACKQSTGAWRVTSSDLGRDLEEDLSYHPDGIRDHGEECGLTPIDAVRKYRVGISDAPAAAMWLCRQLGIEPASLGWRADNDAGTTDPDLARMNAELRGRQGGRKNSGRLDGRQHHLSGL